MWESYSSFLDYLELRRRVERRLMSTHWLLLHIVLFVAITIGLLSGYATTPQNGSFSTSAAANVMVIWSGILVLHSIWTHMRSGAWAFRRSQIIETEMRERLRKADTLLIQDERSLFRLHGLLEEDILSRSRKVLPLIIFTVVNLFNWVATNGGYQTSYPWQVTPVIALLLLPVLLINSFRSARREHRLMKLMASGEVIPKAKIDTLPRYLQLADDEMLEIVEEDDEKPKRVLR